MSTEILQPFQLAANGGIATTSDPNRQTEQHIMSLISTSPNERVMVPTYGVPVKDNVFAPDSQVVSALLKSQIQAAMNTFERNVNVQAITVANTGDPFDPVSISIDWNINQIQSGAANGVQTATILVGGSIVQNGVLVP